MKKILLLASGTGSNVENIIRYFKNNNDIVIVGVFSNNLHAKVLDKTKRHNVASWVFNRTDLNEGLVLEKINELQPDLIVLAGFLWKFPEHIIAKYPNKIINIHPSLLPLYGGKGMYGNHVHKAVLEANEIESGITIHYVNEEYDKGEFILQVKCKIDTGETAESLQHKIRKLELENLPKAIEKFISENDIKTSLVG